MPAIADEAAQATAAAAVCGRRMMYYGQFLLVRVEL
jgi:hypothetical protein